MTSFVSIPSLITFHGDAPPNRLLLFGHEDHADAAFADFLEELVATDQIAGSSFN
jgi:hypothetical protein